VRVLRHFCIQKAKSTQIRHVKYREFVNKIAPMIILVGGTLKVARSRYDHVRPPLSVARCDIIMSQWHNFEACDIIFCLWHSDIICDIIGSPNKVGWTIGGDGVCFCPDFLEVEECSDFDAVFFKRSAILELSQERAKPKFAEMVLGVKMLTLWFFGHFRNVRKVPERFSRRC